MQLKTQPGLAPPAKRYDFYVSRKRISQYQEPHYTLLYITTLGEIRPAPGNIAEFSAAGIAAITLFGILLTLLRAKYLRNSFISGRNELLQCL